VSASAGGARRVLVHGVGAVCAAGVGAGSVLGGIVGAGGCFASRRLLLLGAARSLCDGLRVALWRFNVPGLTRDMVKRARLLRAFSIVFVRGLVSGAAWRVQLRRGAAAVAALAGPVTGFRWRCVRWIVSSFRAALWAFLAVWEGMKKAPARGRGGLCLFCYNVNLFTGLFVNYFNIRPSPFLVIWFSAFVKFVHHFYSCIFIVYAITFFVVCIHHYIIYNTHYIISLY